ncbi:MAG: metallophosphoesterase, partial [Desulfuromonas sp.]
GKPMLLFIALFLSIYGLMHLMVWWGLRPLLPTGKKARILLLCWVGGMIIAPILTRLLERLDLPLAARLWAWVGYLWMGFLWLAFALFVAQALWNGLVLLIGRKVTPVAGWMLRGQRVTLFIVLVVLCAGTYAFFEARWLHTEHVVLESPLLPANRPKLRIVQISDVHLGLLNRETQLAAILREVSRLQPDLLAATGDILDAGANHLEGLTEFWQAVNPPLGKFAVIGNHEIYAGIDQSIAFFEEAGFVVLSNRLVETGGIQVAGVIDPARQTSPNDALALTTARPDSFTLYLKHRPWVAEESLGRFNLQLSGHTHRGQIFPFNLVTALAYPRQDGLYLLENDSHLYTSRGTGCWGPPMRLFSPPEITVIDIVSPANR